MSNTKSNQSKEILNLAQEALDRLKEISRNKNFNFPDLKIKKLCVIKESLANLEKIQSIDFKNLNNDDKKNYNAILNVLENYSFGISKENKFETVKLSPLYRDDGSGIYEILGLKDIKENINKKLSNLKQEIDNEVKKLEEILENIGFNKNDYKLKFEITNENLRENLKGNNKSNQNVNLNEVKEIEQKIGQNVDGNSFNKK